MSGGIGKIELSVKDTKLKNQTALGLLDFSIVLVFPVHRFTFIILRDYW